MPRRTNRSERTTKGPSVVTTQSGGLIVVAAGTPTGNGTMDFSIATGDDTGLLALLEDI